MLGASTARDDGVLVDVAHQADLALDRGRDRAGRSGSTIASGWMPMLRSAATECWVGLVFSSPLGPMYGSSETCRKKHVVAADLVADLADGLQERQRLDVADRAADLGDDHVDVGTRHAPDAVLDLVGDVRDDLHGVAEVLAAALLGDDVGVDLAGGDVRRAVQLGVEEALVVADVEVGLGAVVGDEDLTVLERVHRPGVDVEVGVELLHGDPQAAHLEQAAEAGGRQPLAETGGDAAGDEQMLGVCGAAQEGLPWSL